MTTHVRTTGIYPYYDVLVHIGIYTVVVYLYIYIYLYLYLYVFIYLC